MNQHYPNKICHTNKKEGVYDIRNDELQDQSECSTRQRYKIVFKNIQLTVLTSNMACLITMALLGPLEVSNCI